ncbi:protein of unknown function [Persephonella hydrogeniphila]|uniref:TMEM205-like domain-containing protein n=1 Tax=Persephonella hydrogeniphila TaxID=198703 RepID=A0A285MY76_9AQUI|nr:DUF4149 domain-containing protein [Persephonella hydrogeniphila]SNZ02124.1 protein of unknown function [Persephonella hydrogeniphila]
MNRLLDTLILLLLGVLVGFNIFFSFIVAPLLFSNFEHRTAGEITNVIFPYYFGSGWIIGIVIYTLLGIKSFKDKEIIKKYRGFVIGIFILVITHMALHKTVLPVARSINIQYYRELEEGNKEKALELKSKFKTVHGISSGINLFNLALEIYLFQYYFLRERKLKKA